jgi:hypothetical protein
MGPVLKVILGPRASRPRRARAQEIALMRTTSKIGIRSRILYGSNYRPAKTGASQEIRH